MCFSQDVYDVTLFQVHSCYGEELGFNSEDEGYPRDARDAPDDSSTTQLDPHEVKITYSLLEDVTQRLLSNLNILVNGNCIQQGYKNVCLFKKKTKLFTFAIFLYTNNIKHIF